MRRKGEDTFAMKRRRVPYVAKIKREAPFRPADTHEIEAMVRRNRGGGGDVFDCRVGEEYGCRPFHFDTWAKARAMRHWIDRSGIAHRLMPTTLRVQQLGVGDGAA